MDDKALARDVMAELSADGFAKRAFGPTEVMAVASFVASCAQLAVQLWKVRQDRALLVLALAEGLDGRSELASQLDAEKRLGLMARIVNKLVPERFGSSPSLPAHAARTKKEWVAEWNAALPPEPDRGRGMTPTVLMPFADMDNYIVYKPIYWTAPASAPSSLPRAITVPTGFVTDLATIPSYFWWAIKPTGRHGHAAILHDWLYWEPGSVSRGMADRVFEVVLAELGVDLPVRKAMWAT